MKALLLEHYSNLCRKKYLGHMRFIGELCKNYLISIRVMIFCLPFLIDADSSDLLCVECFATLVTSIGHLSGEQSNTLESVGRKISMVKLMKSWKDVEVLVKGKKTSIRIRFMLQDLMHLKENGEFYYD